MLNNISHEVNEIRPSSPCDHGGLHHESKYNRDECADLQEAIGYLYEFRKKLDKLHPNVRGLINDMLQTKRNY